MQEMKLWIDLAGVVIEVLLLAYFMHALLGAMRCKWYVGLGVYFVLGCCLWGISHGVAWAYWRTTCCLLVIPLLLAAFYRSKIWTNLFAAFCYMLLSSSLEYIVHAALMLITGDVYATGGHDLEDYILGMTISKCLMLIMTQLMIEYFRRSKNKLGQLLLGDFALLFFYPLVSMLAFFKLYRAVIQNNALSEVWDLLVIAILLLASDIGIFILFNKMRRSNQLEWENALVRQQLERQQQFYSAQAEKYQALRAWNHEFKNTLVVIAGFIRKDEPQQVLDYIAKTEKKLKQSTMELTGHIALDAILNNKQQMAQDMQIELEYTIGLLEPLELEVMDLVVVLANGLDNALEATAKLAEPAGQVISCQLTLQQSWLRIIITNPVAQQVKLTDQKLPTDKGDTLRHGIGLNNVRYMVERYHGKLELKCDDSQFTFMAIMANERPFVT